MNKFNRNIIITLFIVIILIGGVYYYFQKQNINYCKDKCYYVPSKEPIEGRGTGRIISGDKGNYWTYILRNFETQEQCIDYCLRNKK